MRQRYTQKRKSHTANMHLNDGMIFTGELEMPMMNPYNGDLPECILPFNMAMTATHHNYCVHFFLDDYQFERVWRQPEKYLSVLKRFRSVLSPDFSLFADMPLPLQIYNTYRNRLIGRWLQLHGLAVIPTVSWSGPQSYRFCFDGVPVGCTVAISAVGTRKNEYSRHLWEEGAKALLKKIQPTTVLVYGQPVPFDFGSAEVRYYSNEITEKLHNYGRKGSI